MKSAVAVLTRRIISSAANPLLKDVGRAVSRGQLTSEGWMVAESFHLLEEALRGDLEVGTVLAAASVRNAVEQHVRGLKTVRVTVVDDRLMQQISSTESTQGVISLVRPPVWNLEAVFRGRPLTVVLDGLQDPGNAGAVVRSAEAFGATGVVFLAGCVSPYNPKTLRASAGSLFRVPFVFGVDPELAQAAMRQRKLQVLSTSPRARLRLDRCDLTQPTAVAFGSEAHGVCATFASAARAVRIPTSGVESLNAAVAAGVVLYEAARQRAAPPRQAVKST
jgi:TrmH family RNA methyltransferase